MTVELRPFGVACNLSCHYCYQNPQRQAGNISTTYNMGKMKAAVEREGGPFTLFGGEALLLPLVDLEELFQWGYEKYGQNAIQTNGVLINDEHIRLFNQYNVQVGISIDGPGELNNLRRSGRAGQTLRDTERTLTNIKRLCKEHRPPGIIVTLHRINASTDRISQLQQWVREMDLLGIRYMRLHLLEVDSEEVRKYCLTDEENVNVLLHFTQLQPQLRQLRFDVLDEMERGLLGRDGKTSCVWHACDPYSTAAVRGVEGNGQSSNCGRTNKDGVDFVKSDLTGFERYIALYQTPQEDGGCKDCRFFLMCKGQCPGTAIDGDWRNRSELCGVWTQLFEHLETRLIHEGEIPISKHPLRKTLEHQMIEHWMKGKNLSTQQLIAEVWKKERTKKTHLQNTASAAYSLPNTVRVSYVGALQQAIWQPRMEAVRGALSWIAVLSVARSLVPTAVCIVNPAEVFQVHNYAASYGLHTRLLPRTQGDPYVRMIVSSHKFISTYDEKGVLLNLASHECCNNVNMRGQSDGRTVWQAAEAESSEISDCKPHNDNQRVIDSPPVLNIILRKIGIDLLGYQPCSFSCKASHALAEAKIELGYEHGFGEQMKWLMEMLAWPAEWSSLHGIAEVKTGILRFVYATAYTSEIRTVRYVGRAKASDAAQGLSFSYKKAQSTSLC